MRNILFIYPDPQGWEDTAPYQLLPLTAFLRLKGWQADILDCQVEVLRMETVREYSYIGISVTTCAQISEAIALSASIRLANASATIIWGGIQPTVIPQLVLEAEVCDFIVIGEGEETLWQLLEALEEGSPWRGIRGIGFRDSGTVVITPPRDFLNLEQLPFLDFSHLKHLARYSDTGAGVARIQTSRGCPFNCGFCYNYSVNRCRWRAMSPRRTVDEIEHLISAFAVRRVLFSDDNFFHDLARAEAICDEIIRRRIRVTLCGPPARFTSLRSCSATFYQKLKAAGFESISLGGESGSPRMLDLMAKGLHPKDMETVVANITRHGIIAYVNYIVGLPREDLADMHMTFDLIRRLSSMSPSFSAGLTIYSPYPGTRLYPLAQALGFRVPPDLRAWGHYRPHDIAHIPWFHGRERNAILCVGHFREVDFMKASVSLSPRLPLGVKCAKRLLYWSARFRWRHNFYDLPLEWHMYVWARRFFHVQSV